MSICFILGSSCKKDDPEFKDPDPCPPDTCDSKGSSPDKERSNVAIKVFKTTPGGAKEYLKGSKFKVEAYTHNGKNHISTASTESGKGIECIDTFPKAYFKKGKKHFESQKLYFFRLADTVGYKGDKYYGESNIAIYNQRHCDWYSPELELEKVN